MIEVIATTISGSIKDWKKVHKIVPLFMKYGREDVILHVVENYAEIRKLTCNLVLSGSRTIISGGGLGTFNSVLEGCIDSGAGLAGITLGFLRKGWADLVGKTLGMPDEIESAVEVFVTSLAKNRAVKCDVIEAVSGKGGELPRHFVGYGGAEIFGRIPSYTENRFTKYYNDVLSQLFGDKGPFFVGALLSTVERTLKRIGGKKREWRISVDGKEVSRGLYQAMIIVSGYLGSDLSFAKLAPLGSGDFYLFAIRDLGLHMMPGQFKRAWISSIMNKPEKWGFESYRIKKFLTIEPAIDGPFPINVDGSTMVCKHLASFQIVDQINLISKD